MRETGSSTKPRWRIRERELSDKMVMSQTVAINISDSSRRTTR